MASAFLQGFSGGMGAMNQLIGAREDRAIRREQMDLDRKRMNMQMDQQQQEWDLKMKEYQNQQDNYKAAAVLNMFGKMGDENKKRAITEAGASILNQRPEILEQLNRNVPEGFEKRISTKGGRYVDGGVVPLVDTVNKETGEVVKTGDLTEHGYNDGSDKPVMLPNKDFINFVASVPGLTDELLQIETGMISRGGNLSKKGMKDSDFKHDTWTDESGNRFRTYKENGQLMTMMTTPKGKTSILPYTPGNSLEELERDLAGGNKDGDKDKPAPTEVNPEVAVEEKPKARPEHETNPELSPEAIVQSVKTDPNWKNVKNYASSTFRNVHRRAVANNAYIDIFKGSGQPLRLKDNPEAQAVIEKFVELNNGHMPSYEQSKDLFAELRYGSGKPGFDQYAGMGESQGTVESAKAEVDKMVEAGASREEIEQYLSQFDESVARKILQNEINAGNIVAQGGMQ